VALDAFERNLSSYRIREAVFLGMNAPDELTPFLQDYVKTFPVPETGLHIERIEISTPFKQIVDRTRHSPTSYSALQAEEDYRAQPERIRAKIRIWLTVTEPAHSPYTLPTFGPIYLRDPEFHNSIGVELWQAGEIEPLERQGAPIYFCQDGYGVWVRSPVAGPGCWLKGAEIELSYDPDQVASRPTHVVVFTPDGQELEAEFDLGRLQ
jgi:hypothetical protein